MTALCLWLALATGVAVEISPTEGDSARGELVSISSERLVIQSPDGRQELPLERIRQIRFESRDATPTSSTEKESADEETAELVLTDGSRLATRQFTTRDGTARMVCPGLPAPLEIPARSVAAVRFLNLNEASQAAWDQLANNPPTADVVVVQRRDGQLQPIEGILGDVSSEQIRFQLDGDWLDVRRTKAVGLLYSSAGRRNTAAVRGELVSRSGSRLQLASFELQGDQLDLQTCNGTRLAWPVSDLDRFDFASLSIVYLSDLEAESIEFTPYLRVPALDDIEQAWFAPQKDRQLSRGELEATLGQSRQWFRKGLGLHSRTRLVYRLAGEYRRFLALATLDPIAGLGQVTLVIRTDEQESFRQTLVPGEPAVAIDLDLTDAKRFTILVEYGDQNDVGDHLSLCDARLIK